MNVWTTNWEVLWRKGRVLAWKCTTGGLDLIGKKCSLNIRMNMLAEWQGWATDILDQKGTALSILGTENSSKAQVQVKIRKVRCKSREDCQVLVVLRRLLFYPPSFVYYPFIINAFLWERMGYKCQVIIPSCTTSWLHQTLHENHFTHPSPPRVAHVHGFTLRPRCAGPLWVSP